MINLNVVGDKIVGSFNGVQFGVTYDEIKYQQMLNLRDKSENAKELAELQGIIAEFEVLTKESYKELVETKSNYIVVNKHSNKFFLKFNKVVSSVPLPQVLVDKIIKATEKNLEITPLIKCFARFMREVPGRAKRTTADLDMFAKYIDAPYVNKDRRDELINKEGLSYEIATQNATTPQVAITVQGLLVCYKVSDEVRRKFVLDEDTEEVQQKSRYKPKVDPDTGMVSYDEPEFAEDKLFEPHVMKQAGDEFYCSRDGEDKLGHFIKVGARIWLDNWNKVSHPGRKGLHCGGLNYILGYQQEGTVTHNVLVDPANIHSFAGLGIGADGALTCKEYFVKDAFSSVNKNLYNSSEYAAFTDAEYAKLIEEVVNATKAKQQELENQLDEAKDLQTAEELTTAKLFVQPGV